MPALFPRWGGSGFAPLCRTDPEPDSGAEGREESPAPGSDATRDRGNGAFPPACRQRVLHAELPEPEAFLLLVVAVGAAGRAQLPRTGTARGAGPLLWLGCDVPGRAASRCGWRNLQLERRSQAGWPRSLSGSLGAAWCAYSPAWGGAQGEAREAAASCSVAGTLPTPPFPGLHAVLSAPPRAGTSWLPGPGSVQPFAPAAGLPLPCCACPWLRGWEGLEWVVLPSPSSKACSSPPHFLSSAPTPCKLLSSGGVPAACRCSGDRNERLFSGWGLEEGM